jgi:hypothetical protein
LEFTHFLDIFDDLIYVYVISMIGSTPFIMWLSLYC